MSELKQVIELIEEKGQLDAEWKAAHEKQGNEYKESIDKMSDRFNDIEDSINSIKKAQSAQTKAAQLNESEMGRKQVAEFVDNLKKIGSGEISHFNTNEMKSVQELKNYNSGEDAAGGVFIMPFLDAQLGTLLREYSDVRQLATVNTISTDKWEQTVMNKSNGAVWEKDLANFEDQTKSNTFSKLNMMVADLHSIAIFHKNTIADAAFDLVGAIMQDMVEDYRMAEARSYYTGNGVGELSGILNTADAADSFDKIERITSAASGAIVTDDIHKLVGTLIPGFQQGAQFRCNRAIITGLRQLKDSDGRPLWQNSLQEATPDRLAGYPIRQAPELADTLATGVEGLIFGNFGTATKILDRVGMEVLRDNLTQYPNVAYKTTKRLTGGVVKGQALKILKQL